MCQYSLSKDYYLSSYDTLKLLLETIQGSQKLNKIQQDI